MKIVFLRLLFFSLVVAFVLPAQASKVGLFKCIGDVCLNKSPGSSAEIQRRYGARKAPPKMPLADRPRTYCVGDGESISFLFTYQGDASINSSQLGRIGVTSEDVCHDLAGVKSEVGLLFSSEIVKILGSSKHEIKSLFGAPTHVVDTVAREARDKRYKTTTASSRFGSECWIYDPGKTDDLLINEFCFDSMDHVRTIWLSDMP